MSEADSVKFEEYEEGEAAFRFEDASALDGVRLHGFVRRGLWVLACDHRSGTASVGILPAEAIRQYLDAPLGVEEEGVFQEEDEHPLMDAIEAAVAAGHMHRPQGHGTFPTDWMLDDEHVSGFHWDGERGDLELEVPITGSDDDLWFSAGVELDGHAAKWWEVFNEGGPAGDAPSSGCAIWDAALLVVAGRCDDMDDEGYLAFDLASALPSDDEGRRTWVTALACAAIMRGVASGGDPYAEHFGFRAV